MAIVDVLPIHVSAQNAAVILRKCATDTITLEFFQASPKTALVTGSTGKLIAQFPARPRLSVPIEPGLVSSLCAYLADLARIPMSEAIPVTTKAGSKQPEHRDVAD